MGYPVSNRLNTISIVMIRTEGVELIIFNLLQVEKYSASGDTRI